MMREQIASWAGSGESEVLEFKKTTGEVRAGAQSLCAMLNHRGGRVLFGVTPEGGVVGQHVSDRTVEELAQEIKEIDPPVFPTIDRVAVGDGREVLVVTVPQGPGRPYCYKGRAHKRVGNTSPVMSRDEYNRMLLERLHGESRWENRPAEGWTTDDLDVSEVVRTLDEAVRRGRIEDPGTRDPKELLRGFGLLKDGGLLRAATVLFGKPERLSAEFPQCLLRVARFRGIDKSEFVDNRQFHGHAFDLLIRAERFLRENLPVAGRIVPNLFARIDDPLYPTEALREVLANAFCHRDYAIGGGSVAVAIYDDRLEITSSGTLHFGLTAEALFREHESLPWNPLIARVFYRRGIIEEWGRGTLKVAALAHRAGLPQPEIEEAAGCVVVKLRPNRLLAPRPVGLERLTTRQECVLALLQKRGRMALREIIAELGGVVGTSAVKRDLYRLREMELVELWGRGYAAVWSVRACN